MTRDEHTGVTVIEECCELGQRVAKALRFGLEQIQEDSDDKPEQNPGRLTNRARARQEFGDLLGMLDLAGIIDLAQINDPELRAYAFLKQKRFEKYLERSERCGTLHTAFADAGGR